MEIACRNLKIGVVIFGFIGSAIAVVVMNKVLLKLEVAIICDDLKKEIVG